MAEASGSGGLGALTFGGITGAIVVVGGVVLYQLGVFGTAGPEGTAVSEGAAGQSANGNTEFSGDGEESGQPLKNRAAEQAARNQVAAVEPAEATQDPVTGTSEEAGEAEPKALEQAEASSEEAEPEAAVVDSTVAENGSGSAGDNAVEEGAAEESAAEEGTAEVEAAGDSSGDQSREPAGLTETADTGEAAQGEAEPAPTEEIFVLQAPELDLVRVDNEGAAVIAGRAQEGVQVSVLLDGEVLEQLQVPSGGEFVSLTSIAPSSQPQVVSLLAEHDGSQTASGASFILAPVSPASVVSETTTEEPLHEQFAALAEEPSAETPVVEAPVTQDTSGAASDPVSEAASVPTETAQEVPGEVVATATAAEGQSAEKTAAEASAVAVSQPAAEPEEPQPQGQAVAVLRADETGIEVVQPAVSADPDLNMEVALDAISYNDTGGVELAGRARPQSQVRVYVDNLPVAELDAAQDGRWSGRLEDVAPGVYTLRLDEIETASGKVLSRLETPFKRETPDVLAQPEREADPDQPAPLIRAITVQKGDTLWAISQERYGSGFLYVRLFEANKGDIRNPDLIYPGQVFTIPE
ncbi:peptidoglycan-binding LysM [Rhodobacteraceae bacterium (ex Bugula neritina AB1)]|nr:peptidoglycan-binding LysM [Rhodobacteraceae bacterium (ex Bugula neritina AB1)]